MAKFIVTVLFIVDIVLPSNTRSYQQSCKQVSRLFSI